MYRPKKNHIHVKLYARASASETYIFPGLKLLGTYICIYIKSLQSPIITYSMALYSISDIVNKFGQEI